MYLLVSLLSSICPFLAMHWTSLTSFKIQQANKLYRYNKFDKFKKLNKFNNSYNPTKLVTLGLAKTKLVILVTGLI